MKMIDSNIKETIKELADLLNPKALYRLTSHLASLTQQMEDLTKSRDNWRKRYKELKGD